MPNPSPFRIAPAELYFKHAHATTNIDQLGPPTTLQSTGLEIKFGEKIAEAVAVVQSEGQFDIDGGLTDKEHRYYTDIHQLT